MAYQIKTKTTNGYRCSCCSGRPWEDSEWVDTLEEALEQVPTVLVDGEPHPYDGDVEITSVEVIDGNTGEEVAWAKAKWPTGFGKYSGYSYTCWTGYRPDSGGFETVYNRDHEQIDDTWAEVGERLRESKRKKDLSQAERDLADAQARIGNLTG